jgi:bacteriorhodopsin
MSTDIVYRSAVYSLGAQILFGVVTAVGLFVGDDKDGDLHPIFALELSSQAIEFAWYAIAVLRFRSVVTWARYIDWVLSTPIMLLSTVLFFLHRDDAAYSEFLTSTRLPALVSVNTFMLSCGFAIEREALSRYTGVALGSVALVGSWAIMGLYVPFEDVLSVSLWGSMFFVWSLYGVAALFPYTQKNVAYNVLDIISKNFYGVFLFVYSLS